VSELSHDMHELISLLLRHRVEFLVCGGHAVAFYGYPRMTMDLDILIRANKQNAQRLKVALDEFGFGNAGISWQAFESEGVAVSLGVQPNQVDLLTSVSSQNTDEVFSNAKPGRLAGKEILFIGREELLRAKREAGRLKDRLDLDELEKSSGGRASP